MFNALEVTIGSPSSMNDYIILPSGGFINTHAP